MAFYTIKLNVADGPDSITIEDERTRRGLAISLTQSGYLEVQPVEVVYDTLKSVRQISNQVERTIFLGAVISISEIKSADWKIVRA